MQKAAAKDTSGRMDIRIGDDLLEAYLIFRSGAKLSPPTSLEVMALLGEHCISIDRDAMARVKDALTECRRGNLPRGGTLLFLSAVALVKGNAEQRQVAEGEDVAIVPLALPITVGPGTTAALLVLGAEVAGEYGHSMRSQLTAIGAMLAAVLTVCAMIWASAVMDRFIPQRIMGILSKLTGLILASLSAQLIFTGIRNFMK